MHNKKPAANSLNHKQPVTKTKITKELKQPTSRVLQKQHLTIDPQVKTALKITIKPFAIKKV
jgi:hypothetical protein